MGMRDDARNAPLTLMDTYYELHISAQWKCATVAANESENEQGLSQTTDLFASNQTSYPLPSTHTYIHQLMLTLT